MDCKDIEKSTYFIDAHGDVKIVQGVSQIINVVQNAKYSSVRHQEAHM